MTGHLVVAINGAAGCGKSTFVHYCKEYASTMSNVEVREISIVDWVKEIAKGLGWDGKSKNTTDRDFLAGLKDLTDHYNGAPFESITNFLKNAYRPFLTYQIVFVHLRQTKDIERLRKWIDETQNNWTFQVAYVERHGVEPVTTNEADRDVLETKSIADMAIFNNGNLGDLRQAAEDLVNDVTHNRVTAMFYGTEDWSEGGGETTTIKMCAFRVIGEKKDGTGGNFEEKVCVILTPDEHTGVSKLVDAIEKVTDKYPLSTITSITEVYK